MELDKWIFENIFKLTNYCHICNGTGHITTTSVTQVCPCCQGHGEIEIPKYSSDMAAAWRLVDEMRLRYSMNFFCLSVLTSRNWFATFEKTWSMNSQENMYNLKSEKTAPMAICLAAKRAINEIKL